MQNFFSGMGGGGGGEAGAAPGPNDDIPFWMKYAGKGAGVVGGCGKPTYLCFSAIFACVLQSRYSAFWTFAFFLITEGQFDHKNNVKELLCRYGPLF